MGRIDKIERLLNNCPEVDCSDFESFPPAAEQEMDFMEQVFCSDTETVHVFPFVRKNREGTGYIDLYIWDVMYGPYSCRRYVILDGCRLPEVPG